MGQELEPFLELTVRVPISFVSEEKGIYVSAKDLEDMGYEGMLAWILEEGLATFIWDEMDQPYARVALRLRVDGQDRVYPLRPAENGVGMVVRELPS